MSQARRALPSPHERFDRLVDRSGEHHVWLGAKNRHGAGRIKIDGKEVTAHRAAWELAKGPLPPGSRVEGCPDEAACVRLDHLRLASAGPVTAVPKPPPPSGRRVKGGGTMVEIRPGTWKLGVSVGSYEDGRQRRLYRTVTVDNAAEAARELAAFVAEARDERVVAAVDRSNLNMDEAIERFLSEYLAEEKGRDARTIQDYRAIHRRWFSPQIGTWRPRDVNEAVLDRLFGRMRSAGLSRSRLNQARSLYAPFFRWAKRRGIVTRDPMREFQLPTSTYRPTQRTPPEVEELCLLLRKAVEVVADVAPLLALGAVTGMRRGELVAIRRSRVLWDDGRIIVDLAVDRQRRVKTTKTRRDRSVAVDEETMAMLARHCELMDERAAACGTAVGPDGFLFSLAPDCSEPFHPDFVTKRVALLKEHLGITDKSSATIALEDQALALYRLPPARRPAGMTGAPPKGGLPIAEIGRRLNRSERWTHEAIRAAEAREAAGHLPAHRRFDGSVLALRKFTSSELLDAGFNISMVAQRQGHGPQVLVQHYSKSRRSADRRAAEHLGRVIHGAPAPTAAPDPSEGRG